MIGKVGDCMMGNVVNCASLRELPPPEPTTGRNIWSFIAMLSGVVILSDHCAFLASLGRRRQLFQQSSEGQSLVGPIDIQA